MAARKSLGGAGLPPLADLFSTSEERALEAQTQERVMMLPVSELHDFPGHPFQVRDDEEMEKLAESITQHGVLMPGLVRPRAAGGYEIVAGHRRKFASMKAGIREMPVIVRDMDDDTAVILMVDSNLARINNALNGMEAHLKKLTQEISEIEKQQENTRQELEKPFAQEQELAEKEARLSAVNALLNIDGKNSIPDLMDDTLDIEPPQRAAKDYER